MSGDATSWHGPGLLAGVTALVLLSGLACSSSSTKIGGSGAAVGAAAAGGAAGATDVVPDAASTVPDGGTADAVPDVERDHTSPDADPALPPDYAAPPQPEVSCTGTKDAAVECDLPTSTCAVSVACDAGLSSCLPWSPWIVFYQNGRCVAGRCVWDEGYFECGGNSRCGSGGCMQILTTA